VAKQSVEIAHTWLRSVGWEGKHAVRRRLGTNRAANQQVGNEQSARL
jgi:hypothetical protein